MQRRLQHFIDRRIAAQFETALAGACRATRPSPAFARAVVRLPAARGGSEFVPRAENCRRHQGSGSGRPRHCCASMVCASGSSSILPAAPGQTRADAAAPVPGGCGRGNWISFPKARPPALRDNPARGTEPAAGLLYDVGLSFPRPAARSVIGHAESAWPDYACAGQKHPDGGFEGERTTMLSITGLTLEQFADLMGGLGYRRRRRPTGQGEGGPRPRPEAAATDAGPETHRRDRAFRGRTAHGP